MEEQTEYKVIDRRNEDPGPPAVRETGTNAIIMAAIQKNYTPEFISSMMDLADRHEKNEARKAYHDAMSQFKANPPDIDKDRKVSYKAGGGTTEYSHASLANVTDKINRALSVHGLSASWKTDQTKDITVTCTITHRMGHSESTSLTAAPDTSGSKNSIQAIGSTISYLERYTILALTGLATHEMDDDAQAAGTPAEFITDEQRIQIEKIIVEKGVDAEKFFTYMKIEDTETILATDFGKAMNALKKAKGKTNDNSGDAPKV